MRLRRDKLGVWKWCYALYDMTLLTSGASKPQPTLHMQIQGGSFVSWVGWSDCICELDDELYWGAVG